MQAQYLRDMARVPASDRPAVSRWLIEARGQTSARKFVDEMRTATGWAPNLANYAQWESGAATPKEANLARVIAYQTSRGVARPDFTPPAPAVDPMIVAMNRQTDAIEALVAELRSWRTADRERLDQVEAMMDGLASGALGVSDRPGAAGRSAPRAAPR
jgi:hypothetical protein